MSSDKIYKFVVHDPELKQKIVRIKSENRNFSRSNKNSVRIPGLRKAFEIITGLEKDKTPQKYFTDYFIQDPEDNLYYLKDKYKGIIKEMAISLSLFFRLEKLEIEHDHIMAVFNARRLRMEKLKEILHYICDQFKTDPEKLDVVKLNKICWFSDVDWFAWYDKSMSEYSRYVKRANGPLLPEIDNALNRLSAENKISKPVGKSKHKYYQTLIDFEPQALTEEQCTILKFWCDFAKTASTQTLSDISHDYPWWEAVNHNERIPISFGIFLNNLIPGSALNDPR